MAKFKTESGEILDTSKYTNLQGQDAINWAESQDLFSGATLQNDINAGIAPSDSSNWSINADEIAQDVNLPDLEGSALKLGEVGQGADAVVASAKATSDALIVDDAQADVDETKEEREVVRGSIEEALGQLGERGSDQAQAEIDAGLPGLSQDLADINADILSRNAEYEQLIQSAEGQGTGMTIRKVLGQQGQIRKMKASEIGLLQARALGLQGQIQASQNAVNRAIDLKYSTIEASLDLYQFQLDSIGEDLSEEQRVLWDAQNRMLEEERTRVAEEKASDTQKENIALQIIQNGGDSALANQISNAPTLQDALLIAGELANSEGWEYVNTPALRDELIAKGYEMTQAGGRTYAKKPDPAVASYTSQVQSGALNLSNVPAEYRNAVSVALGGYTPPASDGGNIPKSRGKAGWTQQTANREYQKFIDSGYSPQDAIDSVQRLTGYIPKGANFTSSNIPSELKGEIITNASSGATLQELQSAYPDVSTTYLTTLYNQNKKVEEKKDESGMTNEEFIKSLGN